MNGAESLVHTLLGCGVDTCFANPGTSEMHFVAALDRIPGMRCVLGLQENVVTGMADGYCRMAGKPAATLLHCGPGLANGLANLHNARRARSGIVNCVGDQATYHRPLDAPLTADTEGWARGVSAWVRTATVGEPRSAPMPPPRCRRRAPRPAADRDADPAVRHLAGTRAAWSRTPLPVPARAAGRSARGAQRRARPAREEERADPARRRRALRERRAALAWRIAAATGAKLMAEGSNARIAARPRPPAARARALSGRRRDQGAGVVRAHHPGERRARRSASSPIRASRRRHYPAHGAKSHVLTRYEQDAEAALQRAVRRTRRAGRARCPDPGPKPPDAARGAPTPEGLARTVAALMPEDAIIVDESRSPSAAASSANTIAAPPHDWLQITGGAIGCGLPLATGAAIGARAARRAA